MSEDVLQPPPSTPLPPPPPESRRLRPRPVVDPALPLSLRERLLEGRRPEPLPFPYGTSEDSTTRSARVREGLAQVVGVGFTLSLALLTAGWYLGMVIATISLVAFVAALGFRKDAHRVTRLVGGLVGAGALATTPVWLMDVVPQDPVTGVPWLLFGVLVAMVAADAFTSRVAGAPGERERAAVITADDVSEVDHVHLATVQRVIDQVDEAGAVFHGRGSLDTDRALCVLRDQEWRIAVLLARQRELRRAHLRRWQRAASPRVREALKPQREHLHAVEEAVRARVAQIAEYGRLVEGAVSAHREWEQCQEALDSTAEYADHAASAAFLGMASGPVAELSTTADLAREVRDERVRLLSEHTLVRGLSVAPTLPEGPGDRAASLGGRAG
ncbi:hypothetical protein DFP74_6575 [Nocardiopsis sp. Huas11]|uniref:hypothetical protein n=1 Tax=Nocardiopsis sp. Huas11 TaxID=2183912 RepID=UPI000F1395DF|nr:hypothetical protein [Nocardiopsis sp. Huas11]RKS10793.1 hypothetical protein DFP74_6575 [Nocardiopsis sp. Huas11]